MDQMLMLISMLIPMFVLQLLDMDIKEAMSLILMDKLKVLYPTTKDMLQEPLPTDNILAMQDNMPQLPTMQLMLLNTLQVPSLMVHFQMLILPSMLQVLLLVTTRSPSNKLATIMNTQSRLLITNQSQEWKQFRLPSKSKYLLLTWIVRK